MAGVFTGGIIFPVNIGDVQTFNVDCYVPVTIPQSRLYDRTSACLTSSLGCPVFK